MNNYKVCVYAIAKNEERFVNRWVESMQEADKIIVLDTYVDQKIQKSVSFTADVAGQYVIYFYVRDYSDDGVSQGNVTVLSYTVTVS